MVGRADVEPSTSPFRHVVAAAVAQGRPWQSRCSHSCGHQGWRLPLALLPRGRGATAPCLGRCLGRHGQAPACCRGSHAVRLLLLLRSHCRQFCCCQRQPPPQVCRNRGGEDEGGQVLTLQRCQPEVGRHRQLVGCAGIGQQRSWFQAQRLQGADVGRLHIAAVPAPQGLGCQLRRRPGPGGNRGGMGLPAEQGRCGGSEPRPGQHRQQDTTDANVGQNLRPALSPDGFCHQSHRSAEGSCVLLGRQHAKVEAGGGFKGLQHMGSKRRRCLRGGVASGRGMGGRSCCGEC